MFTAELLAGQHILVTGGGTGLGRAMAARFLQLGAEVSICGRRQAVCEETARALMDAHGGTVRAYGVDIREVEAVRAMVDDLFAVRPLTGLVNNAAGNFISRTEDISPRGFEAIARTVMHGGFHVTQAVGQHWIRQAREGAWQMGQPYRSVLSVVVTWVRNGGPFVVPSAMSKAAVAAMTTSLASEWARHGIRLNAVAPGEIPTEGMSARLSPGEAPGQRSREHNPMGRPGTMDELANLATFLMSPGCDWLTGEVIAMDGANARANGGNFYPLRHWTDDDWRTARERIRAQDAADRAPRQRPS